MSWKFTDAERKKVYDAWENFSISDFDDDSMHRLVSILVPIASKVHGGPGTTFDDEPPDCSGAHLVEDDGVVTCLHNGAIIE